MHVCVTNNINNDLLPKHDVFQTRFDKVHKLLASIQQASGGLNIFKVIYLYFKYS